jgi:fluoroacetyl-CoA thioesterase
MTTISVGTKGEFQALVTRENSTGFLGTEDARVLSTPHMIGLMEKTCRDTVLPLLDSGYDTVGTHVNVWHLAAAPVGSTVTFRAEVVDVSGRRVQFRVEAVNEREKLGEGTHERTIINVAKFAAKQAEKRKTGTAGLGTEETGDGPIPA